MTLSSSLHLLRVMLCQKFCRLLLPVQKASSAFGRWRQEDWAILSNTEFEGALGGGIAFMVFNKIIKYI